MTNFWGDFKKIAANFQKFGKTMCESENLWFEWENWLS